MNKDSIWLSFLSVLTIILATSVVYVGSKLANTFQTNSKYRVVVWLALGFWGLGLIGFRIFVNAFRKGEIERFPQILTWVNWVTYTFLGFMTILVFFYMITDLFLLFNKFFKYSFAQTHTSIATNPSRREFFQKMLPWVTVGGASFLTGLGLNAAIRGPEVKHVRVPKKGLHPDLENFKIVQLSDLHVGATIDKNYVQNVVNKVLKLNPDLIALTGDFVDGSVRDLKDAVAPLKDLRAKHGVYYITGNHEYYWNGPAWIEHFKEMGFKVLLNSHDVVRNNQGSILVVGTPDPQAARFNPEDAIDVMRATKGAPVCDYTLFLTHQPKSFKEGEKINCDLQLSGHTHSGQFFPANLFIGMIHKYYRGLNKHTDTMWVYVNKGTGHWGPPNRLGVPSEISLIELYRS